MKQEIKKIGVLTLMLLVIFSFSFAQNSKGNVRCPKKLLVKVDKIKKGNITKYKKFTGSFDFERVSIVSPVSGTVTEVKASENNVVSKDMIVLILNNGLSDEIDKLDKNIKKWKRILNRRKHWKVRSPRAEAQAERNIKKYTNLLELKKQEAEKYKIKTPVGGEIEKLYVKVGDTVNEGETIGRIVIKKHMFSSINISEKDKSLFSGKEEIEIVSIEDKKKLNVKIKDISGEKIVLFFNNESLTIDSPFDFCFKLKEKEYKNVVILPESFVKKSANKYFVFLLGEKQTFLGLIKKKVAIKYNILVDDFIDGKYVINPKSKFSEQDLLITKVIISPMKEVSPSHCMCLKDGVEVKLSKKIGKVSLRKAEKKKEIKKEKEKKEIVKKKKEEKVVKKEKSVKEKKIVEKKKIQGEKIKILGDRFGLFLIGSNFNINDEDFGNFYERSKNLLGAELDIRIMYGFHIWGTIKKYEDNSTTTYYKKKTTFTIHPNNIGIRYVIYKNKYASPFVGIALNMFSYEEDTPELVTTGSASGYAFDFGLFIGGGIKYVEGIIHVKYNSVKDTVGNKEFDMSGVETIFGIGVRF